MPVVVKMRRFFRQEEEGQAALEFVLLLPFFVVFLFLIVDLGILMYEWVSAGNAAREGARYGAVGCNAATGATGNCAVGVIQNWASQRSGQVIAPGEVTVNWLNRTGSPTNAGEKGDSVVIKVNHTYHFLFIGPPIASAVSFPIVACADMRLERNEGATKTPAAASAGC
jgi:Flp pilus assembly protein TadG